ncbi:MAG: GNAT family N-acetyltransferase [Acidiphilium sp.]|nr:GNAT family N-acetyltransferase [Acidiphilium sp.]MDD4934764.1 GNAT family N-acetyltransferase [Acidiphilium sp.]
MSTMQIRDMPPPETLAVDRLTVISDDDMQSLCEAADAAIIDGGGFGWLKPPGRAALEQYFRGVVMVPERELFVGRMDGTIYGAAQLVRPPRNNEAQALGATLALNFVAPYARGHGLARLIVLRLEDRARALGYQVLNLDVRETQTAAIALYEGAGFTRWGTHPAYARTDGRTVGGHFYYKMLQAR